MEELTVVFMTQVIGSEARLTVQQVDRSQGDDGMPSAQYCRRWLSRFCVT
jgi:hypothetical protein